jgi:hypothetical protein
LPKRESFRIKNKIWKKNLAELQFAKNWTDVEKLKT